jgi:riboflavin biosynthesis pyrimidine reductase
MPIERLLDLTNDHPDPEALYTTIQFPEPPDDRPYVFVNMVSTACGKILQAPRGSSAKGLGSPTDQLLMKRLQGLADGAISGAGTIRIGNVVYRPEMWRCTVTRSGDLPEETRFFTDAPDKVIVFAPRNLDKAVASRLAAKWKLHLVGDTDADAKELLTVLRKEYGLKVVAMEGGADLNYSFFEAGVVDELFLSFAPKIKGGKDLPTVVDGPGLPGNEVVNMDLLSVYRDESELYFRYRVQPGQR